MGTSRQATPRRSATLGDSDADKWLRGEDDCGFFVFIGEDYLRKLWSDNCDDIVAEHIETTPGTRPQRWWEFDSKEPRQRLGGIGTVASDVLNCVPSFQFGLPLMWVSEFDVAYHNRLGMFSHVAPNPNSAGPFLGVAISKDDPPTFESEAAYLDRLNLFLPGEKRRVKKADFEPETIAYVE